MSLFSRNKKEEAVEKPDTEKKAAAVKSKAVSTALPTDRDLESVIIAPRVSEKAVVMNERNVYTFQVRPDATKFDVSDAIKKLFNVTPLKVNIVNKTARQYKSRAKGRTITEKGQKKAYVYLSDGDTIDLA